jgi:hypothetical protein
MLGAGVSFEFVEAYGAARVHILDALADSFEHSGVLGNLAKLLVGGGILDNQLGLAVDGEDDRLAGPLQLLNKF